jgi:hypothetical protein
MVVVVVVVVVAVAAAAAAAAVAVAVAAVVVVVVVVVVNSKFVKYLPQVYRFCAPYMICVRCVLQCCIIVVCNFETALPTQWVEVFVKYYPPKLHITSCNVSSG